MGVLRGGAYQVEEGGNVEFAGVGEVGEPDTGHQGADLASGGGDAVARGADVGGEHLTGQQPGGSVGAELSEEGTQEVQSLQAPQASDVVLPRVVPVLLHTSSHVWHSPHAAFKIT